MRGLAGLLTLLTSQKKEERGENQVDGNDQKNGNNDGGCRGAADLFGAGSGGKTFLTADRGDGDAEHEALNQATDDVAKEESVGCRMKIAQKSEAGFCDAEKRGTAGSVSTVRTTRFNEQEKARLQPSA